MTLRYTFQPDCYRAGRRRRRASQTIDRLDLGPADRGLGRERRSHAVRRHADGDEHDRGARHREPPRGLELPLGPVLPVRQAADGAADLGARARQALRHRRHAGRARDLARVSRVAVVGRALLLPPAHAPEEINVDAITCPTRFNSAKGKLDASTKSYYPPRNDLTMFSSGDCDAVGGDVARVHGQRDQLRGARTISTRSRRRRRPTARRTRGTLDDPGDAAGRRLRAARRGEQGVRQQRRPHATRRTTDPQLAGLRPARTTSASRRSSTACRFTSTSAPARRAAATTSQIAGYSDWTGPGRRDHPARRDHLDRRSRLGRGAPARDLDRRRHRPGARQRRALRLDDACTPPPPAARRRCPRRWPPTGAGSPTPRPSSPSRTRRPTAAARRQLRDPLPRGRHR